jgi:hypothetical protein
MDSGPGWRVLCLSLNAIEYLHLSKWPIFTVLPASLWVNLQQKLSGKRHGFDIQVIDL